MSPNYQLKILKTWSEVEKLASQWPALLSASSADHIFNTFTWHNIWWNFFGSHKSPHIVTVYNNGELVGLAALAAMHFKFLFFKIKIIRFIGDPEADYHDVIVKKGDEDTVNRLFMEHFINLAKGDGYLIFLSEVRADSCFLPYFQQTAYPYKNQEIVNQCFQLDFQKIDEKSFQKIIQKNDTKHKLKKLIGLGAVAYSLVIEENELVGQMEKFFELYIKRAKVKGYLRFFNHQDYRDFYQAVAREFLRNGWLRLWRLQLNGKIIALDLNYYYHNIYYRYLPAFEESLARFSPGSLLLEHVLEEAKKEAVIYDFLRGGESYKERYTNKILMSYFLKIYPNKFWQISDRWWQKAKNKLKRVKTILNFYHYFRSIIF